MNQFDFIPVNEFERIRKAVDDLDDKLCLLSNMCRLNALVAVKRAGSGHLGSSFSSLDIVSRLYYHEMNTSKIGWGHPDRDIYFSSKGHDVPGLYAVLFSLGVISESVFFRLRRLGGLEGHPDVRVKGIESNSGSLGMGISKARGIGWAKKFLGRKGRVFVMIGDGELQEGQNYEGLQAGSHHRSGNLTVILDHNKIQSDKPVAEIIGLLDIEAKFQSFGWHVERCDGHDQYQIGAILDKFRLIEDGPKLLIADTIKGRGVSFMEHPQALKDGEGYYRWHAGAPSDDSYLQAHQELTKRINQQLESLDLSRLSFSIWKESTPSVQVDLQGEPASAGIGTKPVVKVSDEYVVQGYGEALLEQVAQHSNLIVLDADLAADCRIRPIELKFPDQFIECGIAEQDMVSMAGGIARQGLLPIVNSFASFLASRANEQIYNNASENTKIIYVCHYAGLIPAGPGKSHQSLRDISLFGSLANCEILQPCNGQETRMVVEYAVAEARENVMIRMNIGPSPRQILLPNSYNLTKGRGVTLEAGDDAIMFAYGPVMLHEGLLASELLAPLGINLQIVNMPWLNCVDRDWLIEMVAPFDSIFVVEDHAPVGGLGDVLLNKIVTANALGNRLFVKVAVDGYPACGTPQEALRHHGLDCASLANRVISTKTSKEK